jgi:hypothetical protein
LVDGHGQVPRRWEAQGCLTAFESVDGYDYAEGEAAPAYMGRVERFLRRVVHVRPGVFVMFDDLRAADIAQFQWLLHAHNRIDISESDRLLRVTNSPAAMDVHLLLPEALKFTQTDEYDPEPEPTKGSWVNTWHLTASTATPSRDAYFLAVLLPHREGAEDELPSVELLRGAGSVGVRLKASDGAQDIVAFRVDQRVKVVACGDVESNGQVFAQGKSRDGLVIRQFTYLGK